MSDFVVASRYAKSLLDISKENGALESVKSDMDALAKAIAESKDLELLLKSPIISQEKKLDVLKAVFGSKLGSLSMAIIELTVKKGRENILGVVAQEFIKQYNSIMGYQNAEVVTAVPMTPDVENEVKGLIEKISSSKVILTKKVDPKILGGFIAKVGDKQIDESVASKLNKIKLEFTKNPYQKTY
ncbi:MAG: ATP synthase F1 subunit delta [Cytophagales bacterium]